MYPLSVWMIISSVNISTITSRRLLMYPGSTTPKKTLVGLPVRNIDYGSLHKSLRVTDRDVKRNLQPEFLESLGKMCLSSTGRSEVAVKSQGNHDNAISYQDNGGRDVKERENSPLLNVSISSPNALNNSCELQWGYFSVLYSRNMLYSLLVGFMAISGSWVK